MRRSLVVMTVAALVFGALAVVGCGSKTETTKVDETEYIDLTEPVAEGIAGVYVEGIDTAGSTGPSISVLEGGKWEGSAWGSEKKGTYKIQTEPKKVITFTFEDGTTETWSVQIANGKVAAVSNPDGRHFTKQEKQK